MQSGEKPAIILGDLHQFFGERLREAAQTKQLLASPLAIDYLSRLFVHFGSVGNFFDQQGVKLPVLADMMNEAMEADLYRRISILRKLGDTSLMVSGYFPEALQRRNVDRSYYIQMGEVAYHQLDRLADTQSIYRELSEQFLSFSQLIEDVRLAIHTEDLTAEGLLELYDGNRRPEVLKKLNEMGIFPITAKINDA